MKLLDEWIGDIMDEMDKLGIADNALLWIAWSDLRLIYRNQF